MNPEVENQIRNKVVWTKLPQNVKAVDSFKQRFFYLFK